MGRLSSVYPFNTASVAVRLIILTDRDTMYEAMNDTSWKGLQQEALHEEWLKYISPAHQNGGCPIIHIVIGRVLK